MPGPYSHGAVAGVSVHGANRLGTNSLLDLIVFGKYAGLQAAEFSRGASFQTLPSDPTDNIRQQLDLIRNSDGEEKASTISNEMKAVMFDEVGVFRSQEGMQKALDKVHELQERLKHVRRPDPGKIFNNLLNNTS